jgi:hypothetical protein
VRRAHKFSACPFAHKFNRQHLVGSATNHCVGAPSISASFAEMDGITDTASMPILSVIVRERSESKNLLLEILGEKGEMMAPPVPRLPCQR